MILKNVCKTFLALGGILLFSSTAAAQEMFNSFIVVNDRRISEPVWVEYYPKNIDESTVQLQPAISMLSKVLSKSLVFNIVQDLDGEGKMSFKKLKEIGLTPKLDMRSLDLYFTVDVGDKKESKVKVSNVLQTGKNKVITPDFLSGYINVRTSHFFKGEGETGSSQLEEDELSQTNSVALEKVLNIGGVALETQYIFSDSAISSGNKASRLYTRATLDDEERAVRYRLGDLDHPVRGFQEVVFGAGASVQREFTIKPALFRSSFNNYRFNLDTDSVVEIFVNGQLLKRQTLPQGPVELSQLPFNAGENEVRVRVTDAVGNIRNLNFSDINDSRLLAQGMSDFSLNYVVPRDSNSLTTDFGDAYETGEGVLTGYYHRGLHKRWVAGFDLQHGKNRSLYGAESIFGDELGLVKVNIAGSRDKEQDKSGQAVRVEHESLLLRKGSLANFRLFTSGEYRSKGFTNFLSDGVGSKYKLRAAVAQNFRNSIRASLGASKEWYHENESRTFLTSTFGWTVYKNFDFTSNVRVDLKERENTSVLLSLNWRSRKGSEQFTSTFDPVSNTANAELAVFPVRGKQNIRTFAGVETNDNADRASIGADYFGQRFEARVAHSSSFLDQGSAAHNSRLNFGFGLAYTGSSLGMTRPIENSFAVVSLNGRPSGYSVPIGRGVNSKRGEINSFGPAVINNLAPYYTDQIKLDVTNLPYGYTLSEESFHFKSGYRSGVHVDVTVLGEVSLSGRATFAGGRPAEYVTGVLYSYVNGSRGGALQQFFTGRDGSFSIENIEKKTYILSFEAEDATYKDVVVEVVKDIGVVEIEKDIVLRKVVRRMRR